MHELRTSVDRAFGTAGCGHTVTDSAYQGGFGPPPMDFGLPPPPRKPRRDLLSGCAVALGLFCTCQLCCTEHEGPWSREKRQPWCDNCDGGCDGCDCCCDGCDCCCCPCDGC